MERTFPALLGRMQELKDLSGVIGLATWDQETYLPERAAEARSQQLSTLQALYHERLVDPALGEALAWAAEQGEGLGVADGPAMVRVLAHERERAVKVPARLVKALATAQGRALTAWREAREARDFGRFRPALAELLALRREQADAYGHAGERYDALLEGYEPGMRVSRLTPVLEALRERLVPLVGTLAGRPPPEDVLAGKRFDVEAQWRFTLELLGAMGFDLTAGRQDRSVHPFTGGTHPLDVRLTTRLDEAVPLSAIFSTIHEAGHGLYEQGFAPELYRTPLAAAPSMGLHESQSRLWENLVGRSRAFWTHWLPRLAAHFPAQLEGVGLDAFLGTVNRVEPSLVRVEADEVTYNLHIVLRYELELLLVKDQLPLEQLPEEWNRRMERYLGVRPRHDGEGVLQDIHWAWGEFGYFPTYALGNLYAASLHRAARAQVPGLEEGISRGELLPLRDWLRANVHAPGYRLPAEERVRAVTGQGLTDADFLAYLEDKYGALYGVALPG